MALSEPLSTDYSWGFWVLVVLAGILSAAALLLGVSAWSARESPLGFFFSFIPLIFIAIAIYWHRQSEPLAERAETADAARVIAEDKTAKIEERLTAAQEAMRRQDGKIQDLENQLDGVRAKHKDELDEVRREHKDELGERNAEIKDLRDAATTTITVETTTTITARAEAQTVTQRIAGSAPPQTVTITAGARTVTIAAGAKTVTLSGEERTRTITVDTRKTAGELAGCREERAACVASRENLQEQVAYLRRQQGQNKDASDSGQGTTASAGGGQASTQAKPLTEGFDERVADIRGEADDAHHILAQPGGQNLSPEDRQKFEDKARLGEVVQFAEDKTRRAESFQATLVRVVDGDTILIRTSNLPRIVVRLAGIDAPEKDQEFGGEAAKFLENLIGSVDIGIIPVDIDDDGRIIGIVFVDEYTANIEIVRGGMAWADERSREQYNRWSDFSQLIGAHHQAKSAGKGIWCAKCSPTPPWEWR